MIHYVNPVSDFFVRYLLGSEENKSILIDFINTIMFDSDPDFDPIREISILNPFNHAALDKEKESVLDVKAQDQSKRIYNIEIQVLRENDFKEWTLYYWAKLYSGQLQKGDEYKELNPVICINVLDFQLFNNFKWAHNRFLLLDERTQNIVLSDKIQIHFFELGKIDFQLAEEIAFRLKTWGYFFNSEGKMDDKEFEELVIKGDPIMEKAHEAYKRFTSDNELTEAYEARLKYQRDKYAQIEYARDEGIKLGIEKTNMENALKMHQEGISHELIFKITGITEEQLESEK